MVAKAAGPPPRQPPAISPSWMGGCLLQGRMARGGEGLGGRVVVS